MNNFQDLAILIPTINESTLDEVVAAAQIQTVGAEIIVIGYGDAEEVAKKNNVRFLDLGKKTIKSIALNRALNLTDRNWFIVLDADAIPEAGWGNAMLREFQSGTRLFSGSVNLHGGNFWMRVYNLSMLHEFSKEKPPSPRKHIPAINMGFTRDALDSIGFFREDLLRSQDYEWSLRAYQKGVIPQFSPAGSVLHVPVSKGTFSSVWRYWINQGSDNVRIRNLYSSILNTPRFMNWPLFVLLASPILALVPTFRILLTTPKEFLKNLHLIPVVYLTKIAWCIGVFKNSIKMVKNNGAAS